MLDKHVLISIKYFEKSAHYEAVLRANLNVHITKSHKIELCSS